MLVTDIIRTKRDQRALSDQEIRFFIEHYTHDKIADYQAAALLMAIFLHGLDDRELATWTDAMLHSGAVITWPKAGGPRVDKHSTGGVGDKISIPLAPLVAACGLQVPMMVGRGLGHTGGTLDKLEAIPGFNGTPSTSEFQRLVQDIGVAIIGQTEDIAPADRKIYALRDVTSTVESMPLIASSIMSKKLAAGNDALILDVKSGSGAFIQDPKSARQLAELMIGIGKRAGRSVRALITDMNQPLGQAIGNANELRESVEILRNQGPQDVRELTIALGVEMLRMGNIADSEAEARALLEAKLADGNALEKFRTMVAAQDGDLSVIDDLSLLPRAPYQYVVRADRAGYVAAMDSRALGVGALLLGGGRAVKSDTIDHAVGLELLAKIGDRVEAGQPLLEVHYRDETKRDACLQRIDRAITLQEEPSEALPLILDRVGD